MQGISAAMIVRNEAERLGECLDSLTGAVDEVIVVDTGSSDGTPAVAASAGARCLSFPWCDDFAAARNMALQHATHDWVLVIDADERVRNAEEAGRALRRFAEQHGRDTMGTVAIVSPTSPGPDAPIVTDHTLRFFHKDTVRYEGRIHEQPVHVSPGVRTAPTGVVLDHSGYALPRADARRKAQRNLALLGLALAEFPEDEYYLFQLGKTYQTLERQGDAAEAFQRGLAAVRFPRDGAPEGRLGFVGRSVLTGLVVNLAYALVNTERSPEAARLLEAHAALGHPGTQRADFEHVRGYVYLMLGDVARSRAAYEASMRHGEAGEDVLGTGTFASAYHLGLLDEAERDLVGAYNHYLLSLHFKPDYKQTLTRCLDLVAEEGIALPPEVAEAGDPGALESVCRERLEHHLAAVNMDAVSRLIQGVRALPALVKTCQETLRRFA